MSEYNFSIEAINVNKTFNRKNININALVNFNINIPRGSIFGLLGPNGAGKSTFINILGGLVQQNTGNIKICGIDIDSNAKESRKKIGIVPQELNIDPFFTPMELLNLQAGLYGVSKKERKNEEILSNVGLLEQRNAYARTLSGGMRRRLLIAKALVHSPEIVILDEPTAGVDVDLRNSLWRYVKNLNKKGTTICLTTHYLEEAEKLCDYINIINNGKVIKNDTKKNILNLISKKTVDFILDKKNTYKIPSELELFHPKIKENLLSLTYDKNNIELKSIIEVLNKNKIIFNEINTHESDLEDVFVDLINKNN